MERYLDGPPIPGSSIPYWFRREQRLYESRPKPVGAIALLSNPTWLLSSRSFTTNQPAVDNRGWIGPPDVVIDFLETRIPQSEYTRLKAITANRLKAKIKDEKWNLSTFLGELPETLSYFRTALSEIMRVYLALKKADWRSIKRLAKRGKRWLKRHGMLGAVKETTSGVSERWLEFRYAISPLVYDFQDMLNYLYRASTRPLISRSAAGARTTYHSNVKGGETSSDMFDRFEIQGRGVVYFSVNPYVEAFKQLGLINLVATLWELTPLSFVADMFLPIGDKLAHLDAMAGVSFFGGTYSRSINGGAYTVGKSISIEGSNPPYVYTTGSSHCETKWYHREAGVDFLLTPPTYSEHPTVKQTLDIIALARTILFK